MYKGIACPAGYGVGKVIIINNALPSYREVRITDHEKEWERYEKATEAFKKYTLHALKRLKNALGDEADVLEGQIRLLDDHTMQSEIKRRISEGVCAEWAVHIVCDRVTSILTATGDGLTMQRAADINDIKIRLIRILTGIDEFELDKFKEGSVIVASKLTPYIAARMDRDKVVGIVTEEGTKTSHSAVLAEVLGIPTVLGVDGIVSSVSNGMNICVDSVRGMVITEPDKATKIKYKEQQKAYLQEQEKLNAFIGKDTKSADGTTFKIYANATGIADVKAGLEGDCQGIGVFATEYVFMGSRNAPDEDRQFEVYKEACELTGKNPLVIRTIDIGGDKRIPYLGIEKEENPFLGVRGIRFCLRKPDILKTQLKAILRASAFGNIKIMMPMVSTLRELRQTRQLLTEVKAELKKEKIKYDKNIELGVMIETPAAAIMADAFAKEADFFSIGNNDLTQYIMASDRGNEGVSNLYSAFDPAVLRMLRQVIAAANREKIPVSNCGEACAIPYYVPFLMACGLNEFSVSHTKILSVRSEISKWTIEAAQDYADELMSFTTKEELLENIETIYKKYIQ
ncbi:MAG: phosphoenolpyruvate--protein phosphotransferase [Lachnospiraceae bacterium]|nr:phosphoenolpyruvate--protein phosphotransferase [Lachnospiraceae bacterium]